MRAAQALRAGDRAHAATLELERAHLLLAALRQTTAQLSLDYVLASAIQHATAALDADRAAVYLREGRRLLPASVRSLAGPHTVVAERLLELALGPLPRPRPASWSPDAPRRRARRASRDAAHEARDRRGDRAAARRSRARRSACSRSIPPTARRVGENEEVAARGARGPARGRRAERAAARAGDRPSARSSSTALAAGAGGRAAASRALRDLALVRAEPVARDDPRRARADASSSVLDVDAAAIRMPDARRELLTPRALHVARRRARGRRADGPRAAAAVRRAADPAAVPRAPAAAAHAELARALGGAHELLAPFLEKGSTAAVVPIATPAEMVAALTIVSLDPERPITRETLETGALDRRARPRSRSTTHASTSSRRSSRTRCSARCCRARTRVLGLEVGEVYESVGAGRRGRRRLRLRASSTTAGSRSCSAT